MKVIYEYPAPVSEFFRLELPQGAEILTVADQNGETFIWARIETTAPKELVRFNWRGTGHNSDGVGRYVGTVMQNGGALVFHLFTGGVN